MTILSQNKNVDHMILHSFVYGQEGDRSEFTFCTDVKMLTTVTGKGSLTFCILKVCIKGRNWNRKAGAQMPKYISCNNDKQQIYMLPFSGRIRLKLRKQTDMLFSSHPHVY